MHDNPEIIDVQSVGMWLNLKGLEDSELMALTNQLQTTLLKKRADSSIRKYVGAFPRWHCWASSYNLTVYPAREQLYCTLVTEHCQLPRIQVCYRRVSQLGSFINWVGISSKFPICTDSAERNWESLLQAHLKEETNHCRQLADMVENLNAGKHENYDA